MSWQDLIFGGPDVALALGPLAAIGISAGASLLGKMAGGGQKKPSPTFTALDEIRRRRMEELEQIRNFQSRIFGQQPSTEQEMGESNAQESPLLAILRRLRGMP